VGFYLSGNDGIGEERRPRPDPSKQDVDELDGGGQVAVCVSRSYSDPWLDFDRYTEIENGKPSTFFFISIRTSSWFSEREEW
jgi:hypothetical protein